MRPTLAVLLAALALSGAVGAHVPVQGGGGAGPALPAAEVPEHPAAAEPAQAGRWLPPFDGEVPAVNMVLLRNGQVLYWSGVDATQGTSLPFLLDYPSAGLARVLDLGSGEPRVLVPEPEDGGSSDMFCTGQTVLPDGQVLVMGGTRWTAVNSSEGWHVWGTNSSRLLDPATQRFQPLPDMAEGRWYPTAITLPDGSALVASGITDLTDPTTHVTLLERFEPAEGTWEALPESASNLLPLYPRLHVVPSGPLKGQVLYNPVGCLWCPFGEQPVEASWSVAQSLDLQSNSWSMLDPSLLGARQHGAAVLLMLEPPDYRPVFLSVGGTLQRATLATNTAELADYSALPAQRSLAAPMAEGRWHLNSVLLPTGEVLVVGGGRFDNVMAYSAPNEPVLAAELFDPGAMEAGTGLAGHWTTLAEMKVPRMYHSTAVLLPDARVLVGGHVPLPNLQGVLPQITETRLEIFEPPYLFRGARPAILEAPEAVGYAQGFEVRASEADAVVGAVLVRPGATTHAWDSDQRGVALAIEGREGSRLALRAPPDGDVAPPGYHMLFLLADHGQGPTPSVARFVRVGDAGSATEAAPPPEPRGAPAPGSGLALLALAAVALAAARSRR